MRVCACVHQMNMLLDLVSSTFSHIHIGPGTRET